MSPWPFSSCMLPLCKHIMILVVNKSCGICHMTPLMLFMWILQPLVYVGSLGRGYISSSHKMLFKILGKIQKSKLSLSTSGEDLQRTLCKKSPGAKILDKHLTVPTARERDSSSSLQLPLSDSRQRFSRKEWAHKTLGQMQSRITEVRPGQQSTAWRPLCGPSCMYPVTAVVTVSMWSAIHRLISLNPWSTAGGAICQRLWNV